MVEHIALIADGNRRWAAENNVPWETGYLQGLTAIENCCDWAISRGIKYLTIYCFSTENWGRPENEVNQLMDFARWYFSEKLDWYITSDISVCFAGRKDRLAVDLVEKLQKVENATSNCKSLRLIICVDYGGRDEIVRAVAAGARTEDEISKYLDIKAPDPDMIIRTGGAMRLSNFLLWQAAYAELFFTPIYFPDLDYVILDSFVNEYDGRKRNFGC
jgi:undecaprenyl diphosphate synthase